MSGNSYWIRIISIQVIICYMLLMRTFASSRLDITKKQVVSFRVGMNACGRNTHATVEHRIGGVLSYRASIILVVVSVLFIVVHVAHKSSLPG